MFTNRVLAKPVVAAALGLSVLGAGVALARKESAPEATDKGPGMALMSVTFDVDGAIVHSAGVASVQHNNTGAYAVVFERNLDGCSFVASASNPSMDTGYGIYAANARRSSGNSLLVTTSHLATNTISDRPAAVIVFCSQ